MWSFFKRKMKCQLLFLLIAMGTSTCEETTDEPPDVIPDEKGEQDHLSDATVTEVDYAALPTYFPEKMWKNWDTPEHENYMFAVILYGKAIWDSKSWSQPGIACGGSMLTHDYVLTDCACLVYFWSMTLNRNPPKESTVYAIKGDIYVDWAVPFFSPDRANERKLEVSPGLNNSRCHMVYQDEFKLFWHGFAIEKVVPAMPDDERSSTSSLPWPPVPIEPEFDFPENDGTRERWREAVYITAGVTLSRANETLRNSSGFIIDFNKTAITVDVKMVNHTKCINASPTYLFTCCFEVIQQRPKLFSSHAFNMNTSLIKYCKGMIGGIILSERGAFAIGTSSVACPEQVFSGIALDQSAQRFILWRLGDEQKELNVDNGESTNETGLYRMPDDMYTYPEFKPDISFEPSSHRSRSQSNCLRSMLALVATGVVLQLVKII